MHMPKKAEIVALKNRVVAYIILKQKMPRKAYLVLFTPLRKLTEIVFLIKIGQKRIIILSYFVGALVSPRKIAVRSEKSSLSKRAPYCSATSHPYESTG